MTSFEDKIGFRRVRAQVAALCTTAGGREKLAAQLFSASAQEIGHRLALADQLRGLLMMQTGFPTGEYADITGIAAKAAVEGAFLDEAQMALLRAGLEVSGQMAGFIASQPEGECDGLKELASATSDLSHVIRGIDRIIDRFGQVRDSASAELASLRRSIRESEGLAEKRLRAVLSKAQADGLVDADASLSVREGRTVIPVSATNKRKINGFVLDESATGRTVYIEPVEVVEINNRLRELEYAERREVVRLLTEFTASLAPDVESISSAADFITTMDMLRAKASHALANSYVKPIVSHDGRLELRRARHPLLEQTLAREGKQIVPLDMRLTREKRILVISGPNAGGKSVCLKTVGIVQFMFQCGFLVPVSENSELPVFETLHIDIGDDQSIDNDLSTYSSHLQNMKRMLSSAGHRSLVLIDEFGTGTEPVIGGAIAEAILEKLESKGCMGVITTHYSNLKYYAANARGVVNGAMTFDVQNIRPLFSLEMGTPGSSFAVEIARKIGLPEEIIASASQKAGSDQMKVETLLRQAARDKRYWEQRRESIRLAERRIEELESRYESELSKIKQERARIIKGAKEQAEQLTSQANKQIENTIREIRESQADKERVRFARRGLEDFRRELDAEDASADSVAIESQMERIKERQRRRAERKGERKVEKVEIAETAVSVIAPGSKVRITDQQAVGEVIDIKGKKAEVAFGQLRTTVALDRLEWISGAEYKQAARPARSTIKVSEEVSQRRLNFSQNIDLRGMRAAEALERIEQYMDDALMVGASQVRILHGKGTGALKEEIRRYLKTMPDVESASDEHVDLGGAGITVVKFKQ